MTTMEHSSALFVTEDLINAAAVAVASLNTRVLFGAHSRLDPDDFCRTFSRSSREIII